MSFHSAKNSELGQLLLTDRARSELRPRLPCCLGIDSKLLVDWYQQSVLQCVTGDGWPCLCVVSGEKSRRSTREIWVLGPAVSNFHTSHSVHTYKHTVHTSYIHSTHIQTHSTHIQTHCTHKQKYCTHKNLDDFHCKRRKNDLQKWQKNFLIMTKN